jgi:CRISPR/Cas system-associated endoribonuclease Cas2
MSRPYVIGCDIVDDRCRSRVREVLEGAGQRVQWSVYECLLDKPALDALRKQLRDEIDERPARCWIGCRFTLVPTLRRLGTRAGTTHDLMT